MQQQRILRRQGRPAKRRSESGQSTVEYAVVLGAFLVVVVGLGTLLQTMDAGTFIDHALSAASHHLQASAAGVIDVFVY